MLGSVEAVSDGRRVPLGGRQAEKALAALVLAGGAAVPAGDLVDALWDGEPPATAGHQVHRVIAGRRRRLPRRIETEGAAYRLSGESDTVDAVAFSALAATSTVDGLAAALALWRGPALAGA